MIRCECLYYLNYMILDLVFKAIIGAAFTLVISSLAKSNYYVLAGLLPLFPTLTLISHYIVGNANTPIQFRNVVVFGAWSIIPYLAYLLTVYFLSYKFSIFWTLFAGVLVWLIFSFILIYWWKL